MEEKNKILLGDKLYTICLKKLRSLGLDNNVYRKRLIFECDSIDFYSARYPDKFAKIKKFILENKNKHYSNGNKYNSLLYFLFGIYDEDPIKENRELEIIEDGSVDLVDIDYDVADKYRKDLLKYIYDKYGENRVKQIAVYQFAKTRAAIQDVAGALGVRANETFTMTKTLMASEDVETENYDILEKKFSKLKTYFDKNPEVKKYSKKIRGMLRNFGTHPAGIIISSENLDENIALLKIGQNIATAWEEGTGTYGLKHMGYVKFDILGLSNLTILDNVLKEVNNRHNLNIDIESIPLDDQKTLKLFQKADTDCVFQFESNTAKQILMNVKPETFDHLSAVSAILRPGPLMKGVDKTYANRKNGEKFTMLSDPVGTILEDTYGLIVYQEQVMKLAIIAGFTESEANRFRKVLVKYRDWESIEERKKKISTYKHKFVSGLSRYVDQKDAELLFSNCAEFAKYAFNKSHSYQYTLISYREGYYKANYPLEYMKVIIDNTDNPDKLIHSVNILKKMGYCIYAPDINKSAYNSTYYKNGLILGLGQIKRLNDKDVDVILENKPYKNLSEFIEKTKIKNKAKIESLIFSGAFSSINDENSLYNEFHKSRLTKKLKETYKPTVFTESELKMKEVYSISINIRYLINDKLLKFRDEISKLGLEGVLLPSEFKKISQKKLEYIIVGIASNYKTRIAKTSKNPMGVLSISDDDGIIDLFVWKNSMAKAASVETGEVVVIHIGRFKDSQTIFVKEIILNEKF